MAGHCLDNALPCVKEQINKSLGLEPIEYIAIGKRRQPFLPDTKSRLYIQRLNGRLEGHLPFRTNLE